MQLALSRIAQSRTLLQMNKPIYLYVCPFFPSPESWRGGFFFDAVKALMRDGRYDVRVVVGQKGDDYVIDGIKVSRFKPFKIGDSDHFSILTDSVKTFRFGRKIKELGLSFEDIAVCHVHLLERYAIYGAWIKRKNPRCCVMAHHHWMGMNPLSGNLLARLPFSREMQYVRLRHSYEMLDAHIFCSEMTREAYGKYYLGDGLTGELRDIRKILRSPGLVKKMSCPHPHVVYNGVDLHEFYDDKRGTRQDRFLIGCVANFIATKSQITLLTAFAKAHLRMADAKLIFVGTGAELDRCKKIASEAGIQSVVEFRDEMAHSQMPDLYRSFDLYVLPSYLEAFNCSLIEAWACGVPCITTKEISFKEVLPPEEWDKWLFPAKDAQALAEKLVWAYETRPARQQLTRDMNIDVITRELLDYVGSLRDKIS